MKIISRSLSDTYEIASKLRTSLYQFSNLLIYWDLGAWKTHFIKWLLKSLWVKDNVRSPSYAYSNYYLTKWNIWHYDLYRLPPEGEISEINEHFESIDDFVVVEWAERLKYKPRNRIEIRISWNDEREFDIEFIWTSLSDKEIISLYDEFQTPERVRAHAKCVAWIAVRIANNLIKAGKIIDKDLVYTWGMLHDLVRYIDFPEIDNEFWLKVKMKYRWLHHSQAGWRILEEKGYLEIANVIAHHGAYQIYVEFNTIEEKIVYFADKLGLHDKEVTIEERMKDWKIRHWIKGWERDYWERYEKSLKNMEKELLWMANSQ